MSDISNASKYYDEEAIQLFKDYEYYKNAALLESNPDKQEGINEVVKSLKKQIVERNTGLVYAISYEIIRKNNQNKIDDISQEGFIGLLEAIDTFDYKRDFVFSTYATSYIKGHILNVINQHQKDIKISKNFLYDQREFREKVSEIEAEEKKQLTTHEISQKLNIPSKKVDELGQKIEFLSLDDDRNEFMLRNATAVYDSIDDNDYNLNGLFKILDFKREEIVRLKYGIKIDENDFLHNKSHTLEEIGAILGFSKENARQQLEEALQLLRSYQENPFQKNYTFKGYFGSYFHEAKEILKGYSYDDKIVLFKRFGISLDELKSTHMQNIIKAEEIIQKISQEIDRKILEKGNNKVVKKKRKSIIYNKQLTELIFCDKSELFVLKNILKDFNIYPQIASYFGENLTDVVNDKKSQDIIEIKELVKRAFYYLNAVKDDIFCCFQYQNYYLQDILGCKEEAIKMFRQDTQNQEILTQLELYFGKDLDEQVNCLKIYQKGVLADFYKAIIQVRAYFKVFYPQINIRNIPKQSKLLIKNIHRGKTLSELFNLDIKIILQYFNKKLKGQRKKEILKKVFGQNLDQEGPKEKILNRLELNNLNFALKTIFILKNKHIKLIKSYNNMYLFQIIDPKLEYNEKLLKALKQSDVFCKSFGESLNLPLNVSRLTESGMCELWMMIEEINALYKSKNTLVNNNDELKGKTFVELLKRPIKDLQKINMKRNKNFKLLKKAFGDNLDLVYQENLTIEEVGMMKTYIGRLRSNIDQADAKLDKYNNKTLEEIIGYPYEIIMLATKKRYNHSKFYDLLQSTFGEKLDQPCQEITFEKLEALKVAVNYIRTLTAEKYSRLSLEPELLLPDNIRRIESQYSQAYINDLLKFIPEDLFSVMRLSLGAADGYIYSTASISKILEIEEDEVKIKRELGIAYIKKYSSQVNNSRERKRA